jgi:hypothetical protein
LSLASDLHWMIREGHVIEFNEGSLDLPRAKAPKKEPTEPEAAPGGAADITQTIPRGAEGPDSSVELAASSSCEAASPTTADATGLTAASEPETENTPPETTPAGAVIPSTVEGS